MAESKDSSETPEQTQDDRTEPRDNPGIVKWLRGIIGGKSDDGNLHEAIKEYMEESHKSSGDASITPHERALISNALKFRDLTVVDVMIPRADIAAIDVNMSQKDLLSLLAEKQFSRIPVFRDTLDDIIGTIHIKDILACLAQGKTFRISDLIREVPIVSPSMPVLDLVLMMKEERKHMALVVDEYGGIDGLVTIGDVVEAVFGEVEDEHDNDDQPRVIKQDDGSLLADARLDIEDLEDRCGQKFLTDDEREDIDTIGGLIFAIAGRIPGRGEIVSHPSGMIFEVIDADPRRVKRVLVRNIPVSE